MNKSLNNYNSLHKLNEEILCYSAGLERKNAMLKRVIRLLARPPAIDQEGNVAPILTAEEADLIKRVCEEEDVFLTGGL